LCYKRRVSIGKVDGAQSIPSNIDYDLWCGPALKLPLMRKKLHYDWHWVWNTGCGDLGNQGIHEMDKSRWALGQMELAPKVFSIGGGEAIHFSNFIKAVRSRKREDLNADILEGHLSSALCHLGNISYRLGKQSDPEELQATLKNDGAATETLARMEEHLAANG